jgi:hypothetical protein
MDWAVLPQWGDPQLGDPTVGLMGLASQIHQRPGEHMRIADPLQ